MPRPNLSELIKDELVRRFEDVVRDEVKSHNAHIQKTECQLSQLEDKLNEVLRSLCLSEHNNLILQSALEKKVEDNSESLKKLFYDQAKLIGKSLKDLDKSKSEIEDFSKKKVNLDDFEKKITEINKFICNQEIDFHELHMSLKNYLYELNKISIDKQKEVDDRNAEMIKQIHFEVEEMQKYFEDHKLDVSGLMRELQVYKKTMFIMEKKIENLYTLYDRISKDIHVSSRPY